MIGHLTNCCGCKACACACPKNAISFQTDKEGFQNPVVSKDLCVNCGLCEDVCPALSPYDKRTPIVDYAAFSKDEAVRRQSSSGGVFSLLAEFVLAQNGVVFGAAFDKDFSVKHIAIDKIDGLSLLRGSKYLQSDTGDTFNQCKSLLDSDRYVLYSGTPCQISGLKHFLKKEYDNLITVDIICHGVPSPEVWKHYLKKKRKSRSNISQISFRDKSNGWHKYNLAFYDEHNCEKVFYQEDPYMQLFLKNVSLRPSCYNCPAKEGRSGSDITLGDFWGIENILPEMDDDKGTSIVMINSPKGNILFNSCDCEIEEVSHTEAIRNNVCWTVSSKPDERRLAFFDKYQTWKKFEEKANRFLFPENTLYHQTFDIIKYCIKKAFNRSFR